MVGPGPRGLLRSLSCLRHHHRLGRGDEPAGGAQGKSSRRYLLDLDFHTTGQAVLDRNCRVVMGIDQQLDPDPPVAYFAADAFDRGRDAAILRPRKTLQPQAGVLAGTDTADRRCWRKLSDHLNLARGHDGAELIALAYDRTSAQNFDIAEASGDGRSYQAPLDLVAQPVDGRGARSTLGIQ